MNKNYGKQNERLHFERITNNDLVCKDCIYRFNDSETIGNTSKCEWYDTKPDKVLNGSICEMYIKGATQI